MKKHFHKFQDRGEMMRKDAGGSGDTGAAEIKKALERITDQVKEAGEKALGEASKAGDMSQKNKEAVDELLIKFNGLTAELKEVQQMQVRRAGEVDLEEIKSMGQRVIESDSFKNMNSSDRKSMRVQMERKDLLSVTATFGNGASSSNSLVSANRQTGIIHAPQRMMTIRDLIMPGQTDSSSIEYVVETGFTNNAGMQVEGAAKGKSDITFNLKTAAVRTIAHYFKASRQLLDDAKGLASYIDGRAQYGLRLKEEQQLLSGDGTGANILGILPQATAFVANAGVTVVGPTGIDRLRLAILQAMLAEYPASGFVLNPIDWTGIELTKDAEGRYIISAPQDAGTPRLWGLPVAQTQAMAVNNFLTGAFDIAAQIFDRMEIEVLLSTENEDDFIKNMCTIRAEERLALAVYRPEAFVAGLVKPAA
jgi:HK97 family phage major capsid protein